MEININIEPKIIDTHYLTDNSFMDLVMDPLEGVYTLIYKKVEEPNNNIPSLFKAILKIQGDQRSFIFNKRNEYYKD